MANERACALRHQLTDAERKLWPILRLRQLQGLKFRRQVSIGPYIADFACLERRLIIEVDGGQHAVTTQQDAMRTDWLRSQGFQVLRFWNNDVLGNLAGVRLAIREAIGTQSQE